MINIFADIFFTGRHVLGQKYINLNGNEVNIRGEHDYTITRLIHAVSVGQSAALYVTHKKSTGFALVQIFVGEPREPEVF